MVDRQILLANCFLCISTPFLLVNKYKMRQKRIEIPKDWWHMVALRSVLLLSLLFAPMKALCRRTKQEITYDIRLENSNLYRHVMEYPARDTGRYFNICRGIKLFGSCNYVPLINGTRICICAIHMHSSHTMTFFENVTQEIPLESFHIFWHLQINIWKKLLPTLQLYIDRIKFILLRHSDDINK